MKQLEKSPESKVQIRFPDCDPFNHLNNSKYLDYIINAREDHLMNYYNFNIHNYAKETGRSWVVAQNQISYLSPAYLMETVTIATQLLFCNEKHLLVEALMWNENKTKLKAIMWTKLAHFNLKTKQSEAHSADLMLFFKQIENPMEVEMNFEERFFYYKKIKL